MWPKLRRGHPTNRQYNRPGFEIINHFTYGLVSDGDLMEGVASEAASLAGNWNSASSFTSSMTTMSRTLPVRTSPLTKTARSASRPMAGTRNAREWERFGRDRLCPARGAERNQASFADSRPNPPRLRFPEQTRHFRSARFTTGCGRGQADEAEPGLARRAAFPYPTPSACPFSQGSCARSACGGRVAESVFRLLSGTSRTGPGISTRDAR